MSEIERGEGVGGSVLSRADSAAGASKLLPVTAGSPIKADSFSAALMLIDSLPLSDAEKADAVRRLMAEREGVAR